MRKLLVLLLIFTTTYSFGEGKSNIRIIGPINHTYMLFLTGYSGDTMENMYNLLKKLNKIDLSELNENLVKEKYFHCSLEEISRITQLFDKKNFVKYFSSPISLFIDENNKITQISEEKLTAKSPDGSMQVIGMLVPSVGIISPLFMFSQKSATCPMEMGDVGVSAAYNKDEGNAIILSITFIPREA